MTRDFLRRFLCLIFITFAWVPNAQSNLLLSLVLGRLIEVNWPVNQERAASFEWAYQIAQQFNAPSPIILSNHLMLKEVEPFEGTIRLVLWDLNLTKYQPGATIKQALDNQYAPNLALGLCKVPSVWQQWIYQGGALQVEFRDPQDRVFRIYIVRKKDCQLIE